MDDGVRISELPKATQLEADAVIAGVNGGETEQIPASLLKGQTGPQGEKGETGAPGEAGPQGEAGKDGASAYQVAVANGFSGTEQEWLESLKAAGLTKEQIAKLDGLVDIKSIGANLTLSEDGELAAEAGGDTAKVATNVVGSDTLIRQHLISPTTAYDNGNLELQYSINNTKSGVVSSRRATLPVATSTTNGVMSKTDKAKIDAMLEIKSLGDGLTLSEDGKYWFWGHK